MGNKYYALVILVIISLSLAILAGETDSAESTVTEQTLQDIEDCMARSPGEWPDEWRQEYLETIRREIELHRDSPHYAMRLEILRKGFASCWEGLTKNKERYLFEVYCARMHWYVEHLIGTEFPTETERQKIRDQFADIWDYAENSLLEQFGFLDANAVEAAKAEELSLCYGKIDAPLMPVYLRPMSEEQVGQIKQRWDKLRYARVGLLRRLDGNSTTPSENNDAPSPKPERDYELTKESLSQLLGLVWIVVPQRPDYYIQAMENRKKALKRRFQSKREARSEQQRLERERSRQLLQVEHISFLLAVLLETPKCLDVGPPCIITQEQNPLEQQEKSVKGGGVYEVDNDLSKK